MEWQEEWHVWNGSCSSDYFEPPYGDSVKVFPTKQEALDHAHKVAENTYILEGGITIIGMEEQMTALHQTIKYLQERFDNLGKTGKQYNFD